MNGVQPHLERDDRLSMNKLQCNFLMALPSFHSIRPAMILKQTDSHNFFPMVLTSTVKPLVTF